MKIVDLITRQLVENVTQLEGATLLTVGTQLKLLKFDLREICEIGKNLIGNIRK